MPSFIKSLFISAVAVSAAAIERRDAVTIANDIKAVNANLTAVTNAANTYQGGLIKALPMQKAESSLEDSIETASKAASDSEQLDSANTRQIIDYINNTLEPNIGKVLAALSAKKQQFTDSHLAGAVGSDVQNLQELTDKLGNVLVNQVASADQKQAGQQALAKIDADFKKAKTTWSKTENDEPAPKAPATN